MNKSMNRDLLIKKAIVNIQKLPDSKIVEVSDFIEFALSKIDENLIAESISKIAADSKTFSYLNDEPDLYSVSDLKEQYK